MRIVVITTALLIGVLTMPAGQAQANNQSEMEQWEILKSQTRQAIRLGDMVSAAKLCQQAEESAAKILQNTDPLCESMRDMAEIRKRLGESNDATAILEQCLLIKSKAHGDKHVSLEPILMELVQLHRNCRDAKKLADCTLKIIAIRETALGGDNKEVQGPLVDLMKLYQQEANLSEELHILHKFIDLKQKSGEDPLALANYCLVAVQCALQTKQFAQADLYAKMALGLFQTKGDAPEIGACWSYLASSAWSQEQWAQCAQYSDDCLAAHDRLGDSPLYNYTGALTLAGKSYNKSGKYDKAQSALGKALDMQLAKGESQTRATKVILCELAHACEATGNQAKSAEYMRRAEAIPTKRKNQ